VLGGEGGHGVLILSPRAVERLESYRPPWPLPKIFRLTTAVAGQGGFKLIEGIFKGDTINTPSMLAVEDYIFSLEWAERLGGLDALIARADSNAACLSAWVERTGWIEHLAIDPATRSNTSVCLKFSDESLKGVDDDGRRALVKKMADLLEAEGAAYDIASYRDAPPGLRIWCGATVETADIEALLPWLDWAFAQARPSSASPQRERAKGTRCPKY
jgi:phosphoserine aminotransferase